MKKFASLLVALFCLQVCAIAAPDSAIAGPFKISFDMGFSNDSYKIDIKDPVTKEALSGDKITEYGLVITNMTGLNRKATITLKTHEQDQIIPTAEETQKMLNSVFSLMGRACNVESAVRMIDNTKGGIASANVCGSPDEQLCMIEWYPSHKMDYNIISTYPWDEGTLQLLKSIHIEKINSTA